MATIRMKFLGLILVICIVGLALVHSKKPEESVADTCFCKLHGEIDDCSCTVESVDSFNNYKVFPRLKSLLEKDYFKYWKVNLQRGCSFWKDDSACVLKDCHVDSCSEEQIPEGLKINASGEKKQNKYSKEANEEKSCSEEKEQQKLGKLDPTISEESREAFKTWKKHDDSQDTFCELDDDDSSECQYVDLLRNPERYTGYKGQSAARVWSSIYNENCFKPDENDFTSFLTGQGSGHLEGMCLEKRVFYRMISGLHTSISVHLTAMSYHSNNEPWGSGSWGPNVEDFQRRFDPKLTDGAGPQRLKNLYFTYLVELRALAKVAPYLEKERFYTGNKAVDADVQQGIKDLLEAVKSFPNHFDESRLFSGDPKEAKLLKEAFRQKFLNISRIMDCVGCDKCRLWGKLQVTGMGTALKILFSGKEIGPDSTISQALKKSDPTFQLRRSEIVALINAFGRLSKSIHEVDDFRKLLGER